MFDEIDAEIEELLGALEVDDDLAGYDEGIDLGHGHALLGNSADELGAINLLSRYRRGRGSVTRRGAPTGRAQIVRRISALQAKKRNYVNKIAPAIPGLPAPGARNFPLGFDTFTFVNAGVTQTTLTANPQKPFKGARLMVQVNRSSGAVAELVSINNLDVGTGNQLVSSQSLPAEGFAAGAFDTMLSLDPATPGILIVLGIAISATPPVGETITVSAMLIGNTIG